MQALSNSPDSWKEVVTDVTKTLLSPIIIVGACWYLTNDIKTDIDRIEKQHREDINGIEERRREDINRIEEHRREDINKSDERMGKSDERWFALFERFHILDKDIGKPSNNKN